MSNENNDKALELIRRLNLLNNELARCLEYQDREDLSDESYSYWLEREVHLREAIHEVEHLLNLLD